MKKCVGKTFLTFAMLVVMVMSAGCMMQMGLPDMNLLGSEEDKIPADWQRVELPRAEKGKLTMALPFALKEKPGMKTDAIVQNTVRFQNESDRLLVDVSRGSIVSGRKPKFTLKTFMWDVNIDQKHPKIIKSGEGKVDGHDATYAEISMVDNKNRPFRVACLGIQMDSEFWLIEYFYPEGDQDMEKAAKQSMNSIKID